MKRLAGWITVGIILAQQSPVWACAVCFGAPDDPQTRGMNAAILTLLGVTYTLFMGMIATGFVLWRKSRQAAEAESADEDGASGMEPHHG